MQRPPIHVYVGVGQNRDAQRTPSPILIKSTPPQPPPPTNEAIVYNKYVPVDYKQPPQQVDNLITIKKKKEKKFCFIFIIRSLFIAILNYHQNHVSYDHQYSLLITFFFLNIKRTYCC